jgi:branched-chain amino acid transport system substrate-binding protein
MLLRICLTVLITLFSAVSTAEIRIGYTSDLSSINKDYNNEVGRGLDTYFKYINSTGGIRGQQVMLIAIDNTNDLKLFEQSLTKLTEENVQVIIANPLPIYASEPVIAKFLQDNEQVIISKSLNYTEQPDRFISYKVGYDKEIKSLIDFVISNQNIEEDAIAIYSDDQPYSTECSVNAVNYLTTVFGAWRDRIRVMHKSDLPKLKPILANLAKDKVQGILLCAQANNISEFMAVASKQLPLSQTMYFTFSDASTDNFASNLATAYNGLMVSQTAPSPNANIPAAGEYKRLFNKFYPNYKLTNASFEGFILAKIISAAVQASNADYNPSSFLNGLNSFDNVAIGLNMPLIFIKTASQQGIDRVWYSKIIDHDFVSTN